MSKRTPLRMAPVSQLREPGDQRRLRHARKQSQGFPVGRFLQAPPMLFTRDGHNLFLGDLYRGRSAFLICSGPSLLTHPLERLSTRGILTLAVNNAATVIRPNLWCSVDDPMNFHDAIWRDPGIWKFVPLCHMEKPTSTRDKNGSLHKSSDLVGDMPAVCGFRRNEFFQEKQWLYEDTFNWGNHSKRVDSLGHKGSRSIMYIALRLLFFLGVRRVFLVGCDFKMEVGKANYAFQQDRSRASVAGNNSSYRILNERLELLQPHFEDAGFDVYNCTPESGLTVFPFLPFEEALDDAISNMPTQISTDGMYDQKKKNKKKRHNADHIAASLSPESHIAQARPPEIPETTLVFHVSRENLRTIEHALSQWWSHYPWLKNCFFLIVSSKEGISLARKSKILRTARFVQFYRCLSQNRLGDWLSDLAKEVKTPWILYIAPETTVEPTSLTWPNKTWFEPQKIGDKSPVLIANNQLISSPTVSISEFNKWASMVECVSMTDATANTPGMRCDASKELSNGEWFYWADSNWVREVARLANGCLPEAWQSMHAAEFLNLFATHQQKGVARVDMNEYGWHHM